MFARIVSKSASSVSFHARWITCEGIDHHSKRSPGTVAARLATSPATARMRPQADPAVMVAQAAADPAKNATSAARSATSPGAALRVAAKTADEDVRLRRLHLRPRGSTCYSCGGCGHMAKQDLVSHPATTRRTSLLAVSVVLAVPRADYLLCTHFGRGDFSAVCRALPAEYAHRVNWNERQRAAVELRSAAPYIAPRCTGEAGVICAKATGACNNACYYIACGLHLCAARRTLFLQSAPKAGAVGGSG